MTFVDNAVLGLVVLACSLIFLLTRSLAQHGRKFPPSPPMNSILGHRLPERNPFLTHESWIQQYGPVISLREGTHRYVVIGRYKAAMEIMEKQGGALVDRPRVVSGGKMLARGLRITLTPAGDRFKRMRRALHMYLQPKAVQSYELVQLSHAKRLLLGLLENPTRYQDHARSYAASITLKITYGKNTPTNASHPDVLAVRKSLIRFGRSLRPGYYLVDSLPWLKYVPWYGRELRRGFFEDRDLFGRLLNKVKIQMNDPDSGPSFVKGLLEGDIDFGLDETEMAFLAGGLYSGGSQTTALAICIMMMAAALYPEAQAAVHAELDAVIGNGRFPTFRDEESLPVLRAFILESSRWRPLTSLGLAHRATEDIIWDKYHIPAGTTVFGNHWAISRDPDVFPDPDKFDLTRWLTSDGKLREDLKFPYFGFGRRVCPGQHIATRSLYINAAFILWSFQISVDESKPVDDLAFLDGIVCNVEPIGLHFKPRIPAEMLKSMVEDGLVA